MAEHQYAGPKELASGFYLFLELMLSKIVTTVLL